MKGLLIKDFKLLKGQKNILVSVVAVALAMSIFMDDPGFIVGYITAVGSFFAISTISYDEYDNGNAFLFSLPITRKGYVLEKYLFGLLTGIAAWVLGTTIAVIIGVLKDTGQVKDIIMMASASILPLIILIIAIMIPFQLKFGGEKARVALVAAVGIVAVAVFLLTKILELLKIDLTNLMIGFQSLNKYLVILIIVVVAIVIVLISIMTSNRILAKKEF